MTREDISNEEAQVVDASHYDQALIGESQDGRAVYDIEKVIMCDVLTGDMTYDESSEYHHFNTFCAFVGEYTPIFVHTEGDRD